MSALVSSNRLEPLELEHILGFTGHQALTLACDPTSDDRYFAAMGAHIVSCDINNPHEYYFLRGHDAFVSALDFSERGELLVSGQEQSPAAAGRDSPVIVWETFPDQDTASASEPPARAVFELYGLTGGVALARLAPDAHFLAAASNEGVLMVWDMRTGEQVAMRRFDQDSAGTGAGARSKGSPVEFIAWGPVQQEGRRPTYSLCVGARGTQVLMCTLQFDPRAMAYTLSSERATLPSTGLRRVFTTAAVCTPAGDLVCGTTAGEMAVFSISRKSFIGVFPVTTGGLTALALGADASVLAGGGDGSVRRFAGGGREWVCTGEAQGGDGALGAGVTSLSVSASGDWVLAGTRTGSIVRLAIPSGGDVGADASKEADGNGGGGQFPWEVLERSHGAHVHCIAFGAGRADVVATGGDDGEILVWDLSDYQVLMRALVSAGGTGVGGGRTSKASPPGATSIQLVPAGGDADETGGHGPLSSLAGVLSGWEDGKIRMHASPGAVGELSTGAARAAKYNTRVTSTAALVVSRSRAEAPLADPQWELDAHRGTVRSVALYRSYILTAGDDGRVCVWARGTRELLLQFNEHKGPCAMALPDVSSASLIHSVGQDRCVFTYDLRSERRVGGFALPSTSAASFTALAYRPTGERELVTGQRDGRVLLWDPDMPDRPVAEAREAPAVAVLSAAMSPSGELLAVATADGALRVYYCGDGGAESGRGPTSGARGSSSSEMPLAFVRAAHSGACTCVAWSPDEKQLVTGGADCCVCVYNLFPGGIVRSKAGAAGELQDSVAGDGDHYDTEASTRADSGGRGGGRVTRSGPVAPQVAAYPDYGQENGSGIGADRRRAGDASSLDGEAKQQDGRHIEGHADREGAETGTGRGGGRGAPPRGKPPVPPLRRVGLGTGTEAGDVGMGHDARENEGFRGSGRKLEPLAPLSAGGRSTASSKSNARGESGRSRHSSRGSGQGGATRPW